MGDRPAAEGPGGRGPRSALLGAAGVALAASLLLLGYSFLFAPWRFHVVSLFDQTGYVTTARWFAETGELRSHLVNPAHVRNPDWRLYMPGHYAALALAYELFGEGPLTWRWPSLASYVLTSVGVFLSGRKLYGTVAGLLAAALFAVFPHDLFLAFTAMSEPTFGATAVLAFAVLLHVPRERRLLAVAPLLALPFLFRETGAFLILPLLAVSLPAPSPGWLRRVLAATAASVVLLGLLYAWQSATGRQLMSLSGLVHGSPNYADAFLETPEPGPGGWPGLLASTFVRNAGDLFTRVVASAPGDVESAVTTIVLAGLLAALVLGLRRARRDPFPVAVAGVGLLLLALLLVSYPNRALYNKQYPSALIRHLLVAVPFLAIAAGALVTRGGEPVRGRLIAALVLLAGFLPVSHRTLVRLASNYVAEETPAGTEILEELGHDDGTLLVCTPHLSMDYVLHHYPVRWSFVPANDATLRLLAERFEIGTVVLRTDELGRLVSRRALEDLGLEERQGIRLEAGALRGAAWQRPTTCRVFQR